MSFHFVPVALLVSGAPGGNKVGFSPPSTRYSVFGTGSPLLLVLQRLANLVAQFQNWEMEINNPASPLLTILVAK